MNITPTEIESLRIAIAEECGWTVDKHGHWKNAEGFYAVNHICDYCNGWKSNCPPPYTTSIDAIQAAAIEKFGSNANNQKFHDSLSLMAENRGEFIHELTALDWSVAFARTAKIWKYKPLNETNPPRV